VLHVAEPLTRPYFKTGSISIYNEDFLKLASIRPNSIDLIVTSPPYGIDVNYGNYDDSISYERYLAFCKKWLRKCLRLAKVDGRFCLNIPLDKNKGGQQSLYADVLTIAKSVGWKYHTTIIWNEQNISRRTAWGSWLSASAPFVISPVELIAVLYKERWKKTRNSGRSDISREEFLQWTNGFWEASEQGHQDAFASAIWSFSGESKKRVGHPAPFPVELPRRCIKLFSFVGDEVLDPFLGSGSTLIACLETKRIGIGVDVDEEYCSASAERVRRFVVTERTPSALVGSRPH
jgi:site-specific DNA-methyltransferase (adenine-specific)